MTRGLDLKAALSLREDRLVIEYQIQNRTNDTIFVCVRNELDAKLTNRPYTVLRDGPLLLATLRQPKPHFSRSEFRPITPASVRLFLGQKHRDVAEIELPVRELQPYDLLDPPEELEPVAVEELVFEVEWLEEAKTYRADPSEEEPKLWIASGPGVRVQQTLRCPEPITVLPQGDDYYRLTDPPPPPGS